MFPYWLYVWALAFALAKARLRVVVKIAPPSETTLFLLLLVIEGLIFPKCIGYTAFRDYTKFGLLSLPYLRLAHVWLTCESAGPSKDERSEDLLVV